MHTIAVDNQQKPYSLLHGLWADEAGFVAALAARRSGIPSLVSLLGGELVRLPQIKYGVQLSHGGRFLTALSLRLANMISAGSPQLLENAARRVAPQRLRLLPLGVDLAMFSPAVAPPTAPPYRIMHAASLSAVKDQATLLTAFALACAEMTPLDLSLHVAGDGPMREALQAQARELGVAAKVHFRGDLPHDRLPDFYRAGHLFALSSLRESQSMVLLEAAACGLPAVGTSVGLLRELLPASCLADPGDAPSLARAIVAMLSDETRRQSEARRLQSVVSRKYGLEHTIARLDAVYRELLDLTFPEATVANP
jgi:glycosyltransferase involved in cell wall biosynthesis